MDVSASPGLPFTLSVFHSSPNPGEAVFSAELSGDLVVADYFVPTGAYAAAGDDVLASADVEGEGTKVNFFGFGPLGNVAAAP